MTLWQIGAEWCKTGMIAQRFGFAPRERHISMSAPGLAPRKAAAALLHGVLMEKRLLSDMIDAWEGPMKDLPPASRARAQSLATSTLRHLERIDVVLEQFLQKPPPLKVLIALRIATNELLVDGIAPHAAVDAAVTLVGSQRKTVHLKGLTNAIARRVAEHGPDIWKDLEPQHLPQFLANSIRKSYGAEALAAIETAHEAGAKTDLTLKDQSTALHWAKEIGADLLPTGSLRLSGPGQISGLPGFDEGAWWVQDAAAAIPARIFGDLQGQRVLDLCAAPGGKTMQLAAAGGRVVALDLSKHRLKRVTQNLRRTGLKADVVAADGVIWTPNMQFDAILLDAPCSATGTIRRHPDLPFVRSGNMSSLFALQEQLLNHALTLLKPGGRLIYCTCSLLDREGKAQIDKALATHAELSQIPIDAAGLGLEADWLDPAGALRLRPDYWPDLGGMDGFYISLLQKT